MKKSVLITRPKDQAIEVARYLENNGFDVFIEPIFSVRKILASKIKLKNLQDEKIIAIIITSQNAIETAFETINQLNIDRNTKIFAVGKKTAEEFLKNGYKNVIYPQESSARNLQKLILQDNIFGQLYDEIFEEKEIAKVKRKKKILYFCGEILSLNFEEEFKKYNVDITKIISYKINKKNSFSDEFLNRVKERSFDFTLAYSQNTVQHFSFLLKKHNIFEYFSNSKILCFSEKILSSAKLLGFNNVTNFDEIKILNKFYE